MDVKLDGRIDLNKPKKLMLSNIKEATISKTAQVSINFIMNIYDFEGAILKYRLATLLLPTLSLILIFIK